MHRRELRVQTKTAPHVAVVIESVPEIAGEQRRGTRGDRGADRRQSHPAERPEHGEWEADEEGVADGVEYGEEIHDPEEQTVDADDDERRERLVVDQPREPELDLRHPEIDRVLSASERFAHALDQEKMRRVVVVARDRNGELGQERDRRDDRGHQDDAREHQRAATLSGPADTHPSRAEPSHGWAWSAIPGRRA